MTYLFDVLKDVLGGHRSAATFSNLLTRATITNTRYAKNVGHVLLRLMLNSNSSQAITHLCTRKRHDTTTKKKIPNKNTL